jgi:hypothetical protein
VTPALDDEMNLQQQFSLVFDRHVVSRIGHTIAFSPHLHPTWSASKLPRFRVHVLDELFDFRLRILDEPLDFIFPIPVYMTRAIACDERSHRRLALAGGAARGRLCMAAASSQFLEYAD